MAAGLGFKNFVSGDVLTAADTNGYLMQGVWVFANAAARTAAVTSPQEGNASFLKDTNSLEIYDGAAWVAYGSGDITEVQAGTGISVASGTGPVPVVTNTVATAFDAKGDLVAGTGADTFAKLTVGANDTVLTADSSTATGLKWATATSGGANWSLLNSGGTSLSGSTTTISGISAKDKVFILVSSAGSASASSYIQLRINGSSTSGQYKWVGYNSSLASTYGLGIIQGAGNVSTATSFPLGLMSSSTNSAVWAGVLISGANASGVKVAQILAGTSSASGNDAGSYIMSGVWEGTGTITDISVISGTGNFDEGVVRVYTSA